MLWLASGPKGAWELHHHLLWRPLTNEFIKDAAFVPVTDDHGQAQLLSFSELEVGQGRVASFQPPAGFPGAGFPQAITTFDRAKDHHLGDVGSARFRRMDADGSGIRYEVCIFYTDGGELRWRYRASRSKVMPLEWYEIHDTAGIVLFPLTVITWLLGLPFAIWGTRVLTRMRKKRKSGPTPRTGVSFSQLV